MENYPDSATEEERSIAKSVADRLLGVRKPLNINGIDEALNETPDLSYYDVFNWYESKTSVRQFPSITTHQKLTPDRNRAIRILLVGKFRRIFNFI